MTSIIPIDYHIHTEFSCDCEETMEAMARAALAAGIRQIGFSDHFDPIPLDDCHDYLQPQVWWQALTTCRQLFSDTLSIQAGVEIGEPHRFPQQTDELLDAYDWDYVLGSLHWVGENVVFGSEYFDLPRDEAYMKYFDEMRKLVSEGDFDILAHMDIVKRYGFDQYGEFNPARYEQQIRTILGIVAERGLAIEVNTSTLRRPVAQTSPGPEILRWFIEEGGEYVTLGSDAHHTDQVGSGLDHAIQHIVAAGFTKLTAFDRRKAFVLDIEGSTHL